MKGNKPSQSGSSSGGSAGAVGDGAASSSSRERLGGDGSLSAPGYSLASGLGSAKGRRGGGGLMGGGGGGEGWRRYVYPSGTVYEGDMVDDKREVRLRGEWLKG